MMIRMVAGLCRIQAGHWGPFLATTPTMLVAGVPTFIQVLGFFKKHHTQYGYFGSPQGPLVAYVYSVFALLLVSRYAS